MINRKRRKTQDERWGPSYKKVFGFIGNNLITGKSVFMLFFILYG